MEETWEGRSIERIERTARQSAAIGCHNIPATGHRSRVDEHFQSNPARCRPLPGHQSNFQVKHNRSVDGQAGRLD